MARGKELENARSRLFRSISTAVSLWRWLSPLLSVIRVPTRSARCVRRYATSSSDAHAGLQALRLSIAQMRRAAKMRVAIQVKLSQ